MTIIFTIIMFCLLIVLHEGGHFMAAKAVGVKVNEFAIGMGPLILKKQVGETLYSLRLIPIGGFCAMEGEDEDSEDERSFNKQGFFGKFAILFAGPFMNVLTAVIILTGIVLYLGIPTTVVGGFPENSNAEMAGMKLGDKIVSIDATPVESWKEIVQAVSTSEEDNLQVDVERKTGNSNEIVALSLPVSIDETSNRNMIGILPELSRNPFAATVKGVEATGRMTVTMVETIGQLFTGKVSVNELTGPIGITVAVGSSMKYGLIYAINLGALISLNLAIVNLLPFPALDGGRIAFLFIRKVTGDAISDKLEGSIHFVGIVLLLVLMLYVTCQDVGRFIL